MTNAQKAPEEDRHTVYCQQERIAQQFFRSLGFRRVGSTDFFALARDKNHTSHSLLASDDYDPSLSQAPNFASD